MWKKMIFTSVMTVALTSCADQATTDKSLPWWAWLLIILALIIIIILFIKAFCKDEKETVPVMKRSVPEPVPQPEVPDDLTLIEGIGPKTQSILQAAGINTFKDLAGIAPEAIKDILTKAGLRLGVTDTWPEQAKLAAEGKLEELKELQDKLTGGR